MRPFLTRLALVSLFLMTLLGAGAGAALADPGNGNGAVTSSGPINDNQCYNYPDGSIACIVIKGEEHTTQTPSATTSFR